MKPPLMVLELWIHVSLHLFKPIDYTAPRVNFNVNPGLWVIMMDWYRFKNCNKWPTLVRGAESEGGYAGVGAGIEESSYTFCLVLLYTQKCPEIVFKKKKETGSKKIKLSE